MFLLTSLQHNTLLHIKQHIFHPKINSHKTIIKNWRPSLQNSLFISIIFPFGAVRSIRDDIVVSILYKYHISLIAYVVWHLKILISVDPL